MHRLRLLHRKMPEKMFVYEPGTPQTVSNTAFPEKLQA
jgi:hypothetical protein